MAESSSKSSGSSGSGSSATQDKPQSGTSQQSQPQRSASSGSSGSSSSKSSSSDKGKRNAHGVVENADTYEPLPYPEKESLDKVTYRDPRPHDWPVKADRRVFIGVVHKLDADEDDPKGDYIYAAGIDDEDEIEVSGTKVEHAQVFAGGGQLRLVLNGEMYDLSGLGGGVQADLQTALQLNANS